jgi:hypothetical protein
MPGLTKRGLSLPSIRYVHPADIASKQTLESRNDLHKLAAKLKVVTEPGQRPAFVNMGVESSLRYVPVWWTLLLY